MEEKKKNKKWLVIIILVIIVLAGVGGYFGYKYWLGNQTTGTDWGDEYADTLFSDVQGSYDDTNNSVKYYYNNTKDEKIQFMENKENNIPCMVVSYKNENNLPNMNIYFYTKTQEDGQGAILLSNTYLGYDEKDSNNPSYNGADVDYSLKLLYNKELEKYLWYVKATYPDSTVRLTPINWFAGIGEGEGSSEYFTAEEMKVGQTDENGVPIISKFEEKFIEVTDYEDTSIEVGELRNINKNKLKKELKEAVNKYKKTDEIITEEIKTATENKAKEIEEKQGQIKTAEEEKAQKEAEEKELEAKKQAEEEAKKGINVGGTLVKYGTYKGKKGEGAEGMTLILKENGQCVYGGENCTYRVGTANFSQDVVPDYKTGLLIKSKGYEHAYRPSNGLLVDNDVMIFEYVGE